MIKKYEILLAVPEWSAAGEGVGRRNQTPKPQYRGGQTKLWLHALSSDTLT